mgnify:FL=1|jgi:hypothetical protein
MPTANEEKKKHHPQGQTKKKNVANSYLAGGMAIGSLDLESGVSQPLRSLYDLVRLEGEEGDDESIAAAAEVVEQGVLNPVESAIADVVGVVVEVVLIIDALGVVVVLSAGSDG